MSLKYNLFLFCYLVSFTFVFGQTDSTKPLHSEKRIKQIIESRKIIAQLQEDGVKVDKNKETGALLLHANLATISTCGFFSSGLLDEKVIVGSRTYIYRFYLDIKFKRPICIYVELEKGKPFVISDKNKSEHKIEGFRETFFQNVYSYLETAKVAQDIRAEVELMLVTRLKECEKYKDCEHCWLIKNYNDDED